MSGARALLRLAWRDARRDRWRTVLIVALVALPVAGLGAGVGFFDTIAASPEERAEDELGRADIRIDRFGDTDDLEAQVRSLAPEATRVEVRTTAADELLLPAQRVPITVTDAAIDGDALGVGRFGLLEGRSPTDGEVVLTRRLLEAADLRIGDTVEFATLGEVEIVGEAVRREFLDERLVLVAAGSLSTGGAPLPVEWREALLAVPGDQLTVANAFWEDTDDAGASLWGVTTREELTARRFTGGERLLAIIVGGLAAVEVALIVGAAFAVSVRRRQRELGLLAAIGATRQHVRRVVLLTGLTAGVLGAVIGTALGLGALVATAPWFEVVAGREIRELRVDAGWLLLVAALGIASTLAGAWWPARSVAQLPVTVALSGRRPATAPSVRGLRAGLGLAMVAGTAFAASLTISGDALAWVFLLGSVLLVLAVALASPWLLEQLGRLAPRLPVGPRLAVRDAARFRTRNGPVVTAAMAGLAASITVVTLATSVERAAEDEWRPSVEPEVIAVQGQAAPAAAEAIARELDATAASFTYLDVFVADASIPWSDDASPIETGPVTRGDPALARLLAGDAAVDALDRGEVVILGDGPDRVHLGRWTDDWDPERDHPTAQQLGEVAATTLSRPAGIDHDSWVATPTVFVPPGLVPDDAAVGTGAFVRADAPLTDAEVARARTVAAAAVSEVWLEVADDPSSAHRTLLTLTLTLGALAGLTLVALAIALASAEARGDLRTLQAVGGDRRTRQSLAAGRALLLSGLAGLLAVPVGLVPAAAIIVRMGDAPLAVPWLAIVATVVALPLVATAGAALAATRDPGLALRTAA